jgi:PAS domain S-box-containing protein
MRDTSEADFNFEVWQPALMKYASAVNLTVRLFNADGRAVFGPIHPTPLFALFEHHGYDPGLFAECAAECNAQTNERPAVLVSQFHGLAVVGASLLLEDRIIGAAVAGYAFVDFSQVSEIQRLAHNAGITFEALWEIARKQAPVPRGRLIVHGELLQVLGDALLRENFRTRQYQRAAAIVEYSDDAIIGTDLDGRITNWNPGAERLFGYTAQEVLDQPIALLIPPGRLDEEPDLLDRIWRGETIKNYETVRRCKNGTLLDVALTISPIADARGQLVGASNIARDVTERKQAEQHTKLLLAEISHRSKNQLAVVQSMVHRATDEQDAKSFAESFSARLGGLAASLTLLLQNDWRGADVTQLVRSQLTHFVDLIGTRIMINGPLLRVTPEAAQTIGMALHELGTNAAKHGALSNDDGTIQVSWTISQNGNGAGFGMLWQERGGPTVATPKRSGFGSTVIVAMVQYGLDAVVNLDFRAMGIVWRMSCPLDRVLDKSAVANLSLPTTSLKSQ